MNGSIIGHLILKDWRINRLLISIALAVGIVALVLTQSGGETPRLLGAVWFFVVMCVLGSMLPTSAILNERKKQTLPFIMSLPVSSVQYSIAKIVSIWAMFLVPWLALLISALILIGTRHIAPHGVIPMLFILAMLPLIGFCIMSATALVGESEGSLITSSIACNSSYWFGWYLLARIPSLTADWKGPAAIWSPAARMVLSAEAGVIALILALTLFFQSRKRDFI
jgi:ABC-type multidrug transport system permease subunit